MTPPDHAHALDPGPLRRPIRSGVKPAAGLKPGAEALIAERLQARKQRVATLRKRVVGVAVGVFLGLWGAIFVQLVSGHDPALAHKKTLSATLTAASSNQTATRSSTTTASSGSGSSTTASTGTGGTASSSTGSGTTTTAVTTSQS
jgi:cytoskeletal protein RodZ